MGNGSIRIAAALSGGGSKGAFQVGVLKGLADLGVEIDAYAGVSTGAIQALAGAVGTPDALVALENQWRAIRSNRDIYRRKLLPLMSKHDASPLREKVARYARERRLTKPLAVGVVSLQSGEFRMARGEVGQEAGDLVPWVYASCMIPAEYEPHRVGRIVRGATQWVDGGTRTVTPLKVAAAFHPAGVLMIRAHPKPTVKYDGRDFWNILDIASRSVDILQSEVSLDDLAMADLANGFDEARRLVGSDLEAAGVPEPVRQQVAARLAAFSGANALVPVLAISPSFELSMTNTYNRDDIAFAIDAGRAAVEARSREILAFAERCGVRALS